jgi:hypothetical protein
LTGKEIFFIQSTSAAASDGNFCFHATPLALFKSLGSAAPASASISFFMELVESKALALISGKFDGRQLNSTQLSSLFEAIVTVWGNSGVGVGEQGRAFQWLKCFHERPNEFSFSDWEREQM